MTTITWLTIAGAFVVGLIFALLGSIKLELVKRLNIGETRMGWLLSAFYLALIPMMPLAGLLVDKQGPKGPFMIGCFLVALSLYGLTIKPSYRLALLVVLILGMGAAMLSTACTALMTEAFFPANKLAKPDERYETASLNIGNVFFALGALIVPTLTSLSFRVLGYRRTLAFLAVFCLLPAVLIPFTTLSPQPVPMPVAELTSQSSLWLTAIVFALYVPVEVFLSTWSTTYLTSMGYRERGAAHLLSGFWLAFLAGRLFVAFLEITHAVPLPAESWLILILAVGATILLGNLLGTSKLKVAAWELLLIGFCLGPIFPMLVGQLFHKLGHRSITGYGIMFSVGSCFMFFAGPLIGGYASKSKNMQKALMFPLVIAIALSIACLVLLLMGSK